MNAPRHALVRSDRAVLRCAAWGVAKAARASSLDGGCQPRRATDEERARSRVERARPRGKDPREREDERDLARQVHLGSARQGPKGAGGRARAHATDERRFAARQRGKDPREREDERDLARQVHLGSARQGPEDARARSAAQGAGAAAASAATHARTRASSSGSGRGPAPSTASWNPRTSKRSLSVASASCLSPRMQSSPIL